MKDINYWYLIYHCRVLPCNAGCRHDYWTFFMERCIILQCLGVGYCSWKDHPRSDRKHPVNQPKWLAALYTDPLQRSSHGAGCSRRSRSCPAHSPCWPVLRSSQLLTRRPSSATMQVCYQTSLKNTSFMAHFGSLDSLGQESRKPFCRIFVGVLSAVADVTKLMFSVQYS